MLGTNLSVSPSRAEIGVASSGASWLASSDGPSSRGEDDAPQGQSRAHAEDTTALEGTYQDRDDDDLAMLKHRGFDSDKDSHASRASSSDLSFSSAKPVSVGRVLENSAERDGHREVASTPLSGLAIASLPGRAGAKSLASAVAATVAQVAAETFTDSAEGSTSNSTSNGTSKGVGDVILSRQGGDGASGGLTPSSDDSSDSSSDLGDLGVAGLPMASSRSPPLARPARPGRREIEEDGIEAPAITRLSSSARKRRPRPRKNGRKATPESSSSDDFIGGLPLAGSKSPPRVRSPRGRRQDSDVESSDIEPPPSPPLPPPPRRRPVACPSAKTPPSSSLSSRSHSKPSHRKQRRERGRGGVVRPPIRADAISSFAASTLVGAGGAAAAAWVGGPASSVPSRGPGDGLSFSTKSDVGCVSKGDGEGRQQRDSEYRVEEQLVRSRNRSENSWWDKENSTGGEEEAMASGGRTAAKNGDNYTHQDERADFPPQRREARVGTRRRPDRTIPPTVTVTARSPSSPRATSAVLKERHEEHHRDHHRQERQRQEQQQQQRQRLDRSAFDDQQGMERRQWTGEAEEVVTKKAVKMVEAVSGLRSTHFAPGYLGVAWPDPFHIGANALDSRARIMSNSEERAAQKVAYVEERANRARRNRMERLKRRCGSVAVAARTLVFIFFCQVCSSVVCFCFPLEPSVRHNLGIVLLF